MPSERGSSSGGSGGVTSKAITRRVQSGPLANPDLSSKTKHEEWTTSKKVVNHKTKQVETRVQRQIVMEDGKVIADSGPQVTTKTTEDNKTEETENTQHKKSDDDQIEEGYAVVPGSGRVVSEKTETHQTMKESKEECKQMHDERIQDLTGLDIHQKALISPGELGRELDMNKPFQGKLTHFSSKSQKITDKEEVKEISEQNQDGEVTTNTTRTHHHEEVHDDEVPEDETDFKALPDATARRIEYTKNGVDNYESLSEKMRREKMYKEMGNSVERRDAVTRKALSVEEEEEIRNCETNRWLEDHFGSDSSDIVESTRTKAGGNVINIQMSSMRKPSVVNHESQNVHITRTSSGSRMNDLSTPKTARFSSTREPEVVYTTVRTVTPSSQHSRSMGSPNDNYSTLSNKTPIKTYYLGQDGTNHTRCTPPKYESTPLRKASWKSTPSLTDDNQTKTTEIRFVRNEENRRERSPVQRSMSQRDLFSSRHDSSYSKPSSRDDAIVHKVSSHSYYQDTEPSWNIVKTLPRDTRFEPKTKIGDKYRHKEYSEVQSYRHGNKTDRCVQVVLSDDDDTTDYSTLSRRPSPYAVEEVIYARPLSKGDSLRYSPAQDRPSKSFYFGEGSDRYTPGSRTNGTSEGYSSLPSSNRYPTWEREDSIDRRYSTYSPLEPSDRYTKNGRYSVDNYTFKEKHDRANSSFDSGTYVNTERSPNYSDKHDNGFTTSASRRQYIDGLLSTVPDRSQRSKRSPERRQRSFYTNVQSPPHSPPSSPPPRLIRADRFGGSSSLSPPDSPVAPPPPPPPPSDFGKGSWSKNKGRPASPVMSPPSFKPLLSPVEIKNMANTISGSSQRDKERKRSEVKQNGKGSVVVQIRDWGNR